MRIVIYATEIGRTNGGKGQCALYLLEYAVPRLLKSGFEITIVVPKDALLGPAASKAKLVRLPVVKNQGVWRAVWEEIYGPVVTLGADIFLSMNGSVPLGPLWPRWKATLVFDIHPLQHLANPAEYSGGYTRKALFRASLGMRKAVRRADIIFTDSRFVASELQCFFGSSLAEMVTVPCAVDHELFFPQPPEVVKKARERYGLPEDFYLFVGGYDLSPSSKKNLALIVRAYSQGLVSGEFRLPVMVVGGELSRIAGSGGQPGGGDETGLEGMFPCLGFVPDEDLPAVYSAARALIFPSLHEGFGIPPLEAMACGIPVVASNRASIPEVVGDAALFIDPTSPESLADALVKVNDPSLRAQLVERGLKRQQLFSWEQSANTLVEALLKKVRA